jgi:hypothetical protein
MDGKHAELKDSTRLNTIGTEWEELEKIIRELKWREADEIVKCYPW